jgi:NAD(P)-dependent dehydrogenase (short-subunit alcohol dehydrogenase family)
MNPKTCVITGANSGIGKAAAIQIAQKGYRVIMACRNPKPGDESLLVPLLKYDDDMTVAAVLYALTHVYGNVEDYRNLIMELANGKASRVAPVSALLRDVDH